jgi:hypothetical protein
LNLPTIKVNSSLDVVITENGMLSNCVLCGERKDLKINTYFLHCSTRTSNFKSYFDANARWFTNTIVS